MYRSRMWSKIQLPNSISEVGVPRCVFRVSRSQVFLHGVVRLATWSPLDLGTCSTSSNQLTKSSGVIHFFTLFSVLLGMRFSLCRSGYSDFVVIWSLVRWPGCDCCIQVQIVVQIPHRFTSPHSISSLALPCRSMQCT